MEATPDSCDPVTLSEDLWWGGGSQAQQPPEAARAELGVRGLNSDIAAASYVLLENQVSPLSLSSHTWENQGLPSGSLCSRRGDFFIPATKPDHKAF